MRSAWRNLALLQTEGDGEIPELTVQTALLVARGVVHVLSDLLRQRPAEGRLDISLFHCRDGLGVGGSQSGTLLHQQGDEIGHRGSTRVLEVAAVDQPQGVAVLDMDCAGGAD
jgi:hypothetical protein